METLREQVKLALQCQPGESAAALNGDARAIQPLSHFVGKVPRVWLDLMVNGELYCEHPSAADDATPIKGVNMLRFHTFVASLVAEADPPFVDGAVHQSRSKNARAIQQSLAEWVGKKSKPVPGPAPVSEEEDVIEITT